MKKDNRTKSERIADCSRSFKKFIKASKRAKLKWVRKESILRKKFAKEMAFQKHMARLVGEGVI